MQIAFRVKLIWNNSTQSANSPNLDPLIQTRFDCKSKARFDCKSQNKIRLQKSNKIRLQKSNWRSTLSGPKGREKNWQSSSKSGKCKISPLFIFSHYDRSQSLLPGEVWVMTVDSRDSPHGCKMREYLKTLLRGSVVSSPSVNTRLRIRWFLWIYKLHKLEISNSHWRECSMQGFIIQEQKK